MNYELSVIIPSYNRAERLRNNLKSLAVQTFPHDRFEAIIVDDGSTDHTRRVVDEMRKSSDLNIRYIYLNRPYAASAALSWNVAIRQATAPVIVHMGADIIAAKDALVLLAEYQADCPEGYIFGRCYRVHSAMAQALIPYVPWTEDIHSLESIFIEEFHHSRYWHTPMLAAVRRERIVELGGYDESYPTLYPEDDDMFVRLEASGVLKINVPDVWGAHQYHPQHDPVCGPTCDCPLVQKSKTWPGPDIRYHGDPEDLIRNREGWGEFADSYEA